MFVKKKVRKPHVTGSFGQQKSDISRNLPVLAFLLRNLWLVMAIFVALAGALAFWSVHYALSLLILLLPVYSYSLERKMLGRILIPPFSAIILSIALGTGIGIALIIYAQEGVLDTYLLKVQVVTLLTAPLGWIFYRLGFGRVPRVFFPYAGGEFDRDVIRPLCWTGWFFLSWQVIRTITLAVTGALDRGDFGHVALDASQFGFWTYFNLVSRLDDFGFFLYPLVWKHSKGLGRLTLGLMLATYFILCLVSGSRGIVVFPLFYIAIGGYLFLPLRNIKVDVMFVGLLIILMPLVVFIDAFRGTDAYREVKTTNVIGRIHAFNDAEKRMKVTSETEVNDRGSHLVFGTALLGKMDALVYELTPSDIPHAGFENFDAILYTFVPTYFIRNKPILLDSNPVLSIYKGREDRSGKAMSLQADAYRRFGWWGVPICMAIFYWMYGFLCGRCYKIYLLKNALWGMFLILFLFSYLRAPPFGTVLESWWAFSYDLIKHVFVLFAGYLVLKKAAKVGGIRGAAYYPHGDR